MKIAFRVDASSQIGTGHFMRCLTLAGALKERGAQIRFISRHLPEHLKNMLAAKGHEFLLLNSSSSVAEAIADDIKHANWLGTSQHSDAKASIQALSDQVWKWLIIDHYALDARWESSLRKTAQNIMVIDDIADRQHDCDVLLDQNYYADMESRYVGKVPNHCKLLLGPRYALLRDEFRQLHKQAKPRSGPVKHLLVFFGGVDADNYTGLVVEVLSGIAIPGLHVDVVIGATHPNLLQIKAACGRHKFICHVQTDKMAELMASADLAIGAGGSASWERCCLGLPAVLVALADNQIDIARELGLFGACAYVGSSAEANMEILRHVIIDLVSKDDQLNRLSVKAFSLVDGLGVDRVCQVISC
jgi:UDP-2,4-diacetamido-2,4,6-trideoxy-beta-L-altropyranose hydrolase